MFTRFFSQLYFILFYFYSEFTYVNCSLLSRVKNPLEHVSDTTISYMLPKNVYRYEPYRGHRTLWRPTPKNTAYTKPDGPLSPRTRPAEKKLQHKQHVSRHHMKVSTKKSYWHHFYEDEEAWPKVVLILSSTERTTTQKKLKKTFASYFPQLNKDRKEHVDPHDQDNTNEDEDNEEISQNNDVGMNWIPVNFETTIDSAHWEEEENIETEEIEDNPQTTMSRSNIITDTEYIPMTSIIFRNPDPETSTDTDSTTDTTTDSSTDSSTDSTTDSTTDSASDTSTRSTTDSTTDSSTDSTTDSTSDSTTTTTTTTTSTKPPTTAGPPVRCYQCGLNISKIPEAPSCYHIFENPDHSLYHLRRHYKVFCEKKSLRKYKRAADYDPSPLRLYKGGCFKRFLDIGDVYNERGCRTMDPIRGESFASSRFMLLEKSMHKMSEGCVSSPHASLTPFSRAITLYARYHVCVCVGDYCNDSKALYANYNYLLFLYVFLRMLN